MDYQIELNFFRDLLKTLHLDSYILTEPFDSPPVIDGGIREAIDDTYNTKDFLNQIAESCQDRVIYRLFDCFLCNYIFLKLPNTFPSSYLYIGPYVLTAPTSKTILSNAQKLQLPSSLFPQLSMYYQKLPIVSNGSLLQALLNTLCKSLWKGEKGFSLKDIHNDFSFDFVLPSPDKKFENANDSLLNIQMLEERYKDENTLMHAVTSGNLHKAELAINSFSVRAMEERNANPLRDHKNYTIILNTLLRKSAEYGSVHPIHIDVLSSKFAKKLELATSHKELLALQKEMVRKYCLMVKNHSMQGYSLLIRQVLVHIDSDLTADLSLRAQADLLNVNASYLSSLFKKEIGCTLTEYVSRKRVERAIFLLNSSNMQIQTIAQYCGITDVNYFTKIFKKIVGKTPYTYRKNLLPHSTHKEK